MADYTPLFVEPDVSILCDFFVAKVALHGRLFSRTCSSAGAAFCAPLKELVITCF